MATVRKILHENGSRLLLTGLFLAATGALASGDRPPEGKEEPPAASAACQESRAGAATADSAGTGACNASGRGAQPATGTEKSLPARPPRYGTGYEARKGLGGGAGRGRGRGR